MDSGGSRERGNHYNPIAISSVHQWLGESAATLCPGHSQEKHRHIGELTANLPLIRPEFTNHALVEIIQFRHISSMPHWVQRRRERVCPHPITRNFSATTTIGFSSLQGGARLSIDGG